MSEFFTKIAKLAAEKIYSTFGKSSGGMLLATSILGLTFSAGAQILGICVNKKYTASQKAFMIPQELGELFVSSMAIFAITKPTQKLAAKLAKTGKIMSKEVVSYLKENNLADKRGHFDFDFEKEVSKIIQQIENSDKFIKSNAIDRVSMLAPHKSALEKHEITSDATSAIATTVASLATVGCVVPVIRNRFAAYYQQQNMDIYHRYRSISSGSFNKI